MLNVYINYLIKNWDFIDSVIYFYEGYKNDTFYVWKKETILFTATYFSKMTNLGKSWCRTTNTLLKSLSLFILLS